jgi:hypothetical protein
MEKKLLDLILNLAGISILSWILLFALRDIFRGSERERRLSFNVLVFVLSLAYIIKILAEELLPLLNQPFQ